MRRTVAVVTAVAVALSAAVFAKADLLDQERRELVAQAQSLDTRARDAENRTLYLVGAVDDAEEQTAERAAVLEVRPAFVAEVAKLSAAMKSATGKVDTAAHRASALSAQQNVLAEKRDPATVKAATATITALTAKVTTEVSSWEAAQRARSAGPSGPAWTSSGPGGYARVRAALDRVGGRGVGLYESSSCAGGSAPACANSNGYIKYRADIANWSSGRLNWAMAHELAHIYQFRVWGSMTSSAKYHSLFGGNAESLANCMALVRGYGGSSGCNSTQQAWASGIWVGAVR